MHILQQSILPIRVTVFMMATRAIISVQHPELLVRPHFRT